MKKQNPVQPLSYNVVLACRVSNGYLLSSFKACCAAEIRVSSTCSIVAHCRGGDIRYYSLSPPSPLLLSGIDNEIFFGVPPLSLPEFTLGDFLRKLRKLPELALLDVEARRLGPAEVEMLARSSSSSSSSRRRFSDIRSGGDPADVELGDVPSSGV